MPSFLLNNKMNPALRRRVQRSLGARTAGARLSPSALAVLRTFALASIAFAVAFFVHQFRQNSAELDAEKARVVAALHQASNGLSEWDRDVVKRAAEWLTQASGPYPGDRSTPETATPAALDETLRRDAIYVRSDLHGFDNLAAINASAAASDKDALLLCLLSPPGSTQEKALLATIASVFNGEAASAERVSRLYAAVAGIPMLSPEWPLRVEAAKHVQKVRQLGEMVELAPLAEARRAAQAELLLFALDEPKEPDAPSEFDGAAKHFVRLYIVDLKADRLLLRVRRAVDPAWVSERQRHRNAQRLTDCRLAFEVRSGLASAE